MNTPTFEYAGPYGADLAALRLRIRIFEIRGRDRVTHASRMADLMSIRDQAEKLLEKWGDRFDE